jgi:hypothetical protein
MFDRVINLITALSLVIIISNLTFSSFDAWNSTKFWEMNWSQKKVNVFDQFDEKPSNSTKHSLEKVIKAIKGAKNANDFPAMQQLEEYLETNFEATEEVKIRYSSEEKEYIFISFLISLLTLIIPLSINYIKNGKFRLWNSST